MANTTRYFVEITKNKGGYHGAIHQGRPAVARPLGPLQLTPDVQVPIKDKSYRLGDLVQALLDYQPEDLKIAFEERGQLEIGQFLYRQLFGEQSPAILKQPEECQIDLRIVTDDEHIARLPWVLLAYKETFLAMADWCISLARTSQVKDCDLPANPRMLIVAPEPVGAPETRARKHVDELEYRLATFNYRLSLDAQLKVAYTWEAFKTLVSEFKPHIVYYYGHGVGDRHQSRLVFASGDQLKPVDKPVIDVAQCLRTLAEPPKLVYLNCCSGAAGGFLGAGWQLGDVVPAVITNRTVAHIDAAQAQALAFWQNVLLDGIPPHAAMAAIRGKLVELNLSFKDARWLTPVLHCHYADWHYPPPKRVDPLEHDPHWHLKLDRVQQFSTVAFQSRQMLRERRPRSLAYVWYGKEGQGVDLFHRRLRVELQQDLSGHAHFIQVNPTWPGHLYNPDQSFKDMLSEAFDVHSFADIPRAIRNHTRSATGRQVLVYVCHQPVSSRAIINPRSLKDYLAWWDKQFTPLLKKHYYSLLTVSFIVKNPAKFHKAVQDDVRLDDLELSETVYRLLDEMERVGKKDLEDFLKTHNIRLPRQRKDRMLQDILEQTEGHYESTIRALKKLVQRAWEEPEGEQKGEGEVEEEFDY